ncbi:hypothetical protein P0D72_09150 [Paraburkholderia sediminicola]|uniref:hypothetical protein n=1 Tax=Paraburkholderia sediminicola TaxID=458836 RepID=UPI0038BC9077
MPSFDISILDKKGSLFLTRPTQNACLPIRAYIDGSAHEVFDVVQSGAVQFQINGRLPLKDATAAHSCHGVPQNDRLPGAAALKRSAADISKVRPNAGATVQLIHDVKSVVGIVGEIEATA